MVGREKRLLRDDPGLFHLFKKFHSLLVIHPIREALQYVHPQVGGHVQVKIQGDVIPVHRHLEQFPVDLQLPQHILVEILPVNVRVVVHPLVQVLEQAAAGILGVGHHADVHQVSRLAAHQFHSQLLRVPLGFLAHSAASVKVGST